MMLSFCNKLDRHIVMLSPGDVDDAMCWFSCDAIIFCNGFMVPKTKMLEGRANLSECVFQALFKGVSTRFGLRIV